uniref:Centromere protein L n=1 Tax=Ciona savignyi TaxID=51511 RepID=H2ZQ69_CIOSA
MNTRRHQERETPRLGADPIIFSSRQSSAVKNTPFPTTNRRRIRTERPKTRTRRIRNEEQDLSNTDLSRKTWNAYSCSPLHRFHHAESSLRRYSRLLSAVLIANSRKNIGVGVDEQLVGTSANFKVVGGIAVLDDEPDAIKITVISNSKKIILEMYLCSVEAESLLDNDIPDQSEMAKQFRVLPLLLCKGNISPMKVVFEWMKTEFDCSFRKIKFNPISLSWMFAMWAPINTNKNTHLTWGIPYADIGIDKIDSELDGNSIELLWKHVHDSSSGIVTSQEVSSFIAGIEEHLEKHTRIVFSSLPLMQVLTPIVQVHEDGKFKIMSPDHVYTILSHMTSLAVEQLDCRIFQEFY